MSKVHFILDEAASLKHLECIDDAIQLGRGYGICCHICLQSKGQIKLIVGEGQEQTLLSNTTQIVFGTNDHETAVWESDLLGEKTITVESWGTNKGTNHGYSAGRDRSVNSGSSGGSSQNTAQQVRRLLKPEEIRALSPRTALIFTPGLRPFATTLIRYYEEPNLFKPPSFVRRFWSAFTILFRSALLCAVSLVIAAVLTYEISKVH
jgi:type IV secretion system protein VirD4